MPPRKWKKGKKNKRHPSDEESSTQTNKKPKLLESTNNNNNINFNIKEHNLEDDEDGYVGWEEIVKENAAFEEYYKARSVQPYFSLAYKIPDSLLYLNVIHSTKNFCLSPSGKHL
jgi:hypothetical protein